MFGWPAGNVLGNLLASALCAGVSYMLLLRKFHCAKPRCFRPGRHEVKGTTFRTCRKHTTKPVHEALKARHALKYPDQHDHLAGDES